MMVLEAVTAAGDTVLVRGRGLAGAPMGAVLFGTARARVVAAVGDTLLRVVVPHCLPSGDLTVAVQVGDAPADFDWRYVPRKWPDFFASLHVPFLARARSS